MYFLLINLLMLSALFDFKYHKIRLNIIIILFFISIISWIENSNNTKLFTDIFFITLFFSFIYISNRYFCENTPFFKKTCPTILSSGDKLLFLSLMLFSGTEKGVIIILFGLMAALSWVKVTRKFFILPDYQGRTIPLYPFMVFSFILIGIING